MAPHPVLLAANLFSESTQLGLIVSKSPSKSQGEFIDRYFSFKCGVILEWCARVKVQEGVVMPSALSELKC